MDLQFVDSRKVSKETMDKIELLAPAGDLEKLKTAIDYGADAVYFGGDRFSLRAGANNLSIDEMREGIKYAHDRGRKAHLAINVFAHNEDIEAIEAYMDEIADLDIDAFIVSDPGVMSVIKKKREDAEIHLSTQANATNYAAIDFWASLGVKRIVLARELSFMEIAEIKKRLPEGVSLEAFVHGAMCISYSGRCLLSNAMIGRDANRGACAHPCRWKYHLVEEERPGEYYPIEEDDRGTYIMNSKDLCMIDHLKDIYDAGISSIKIEGRIKTMFYVATVVNAYRRALDEMYEAIEAGREYKPNPKWMEEVRKVSYRGFTTGFYYEKPDDDDQNYETSSYIKDYSFVGVVRDYDEENRIATVEQRNKIVLGDEIEIFGPGVDFFKYKVEEMWNEDGEAIEAAPHAQQILRMPINEPVEPGFILRKEQR